MAWWTAPIRSFLPLTAGLVLMGASDNCRILILHGQNGEECPALDASCPLDCGLSTDDQGCPLCECATTTSCASIDCPYGSRCVEHDDGEPTCEFGAPPPGACYSDADCGNAEFCEFYECGAGEADRPQTPDAEVPERCPGVCLARLEVSPCEQIDCPEGTRCEESSVGPQCVSHTASCDSDDDCGPGAYCEVNFAVADPFCEPSSSVCAPPSTSGICVARPMPSCTSSDQCGTGQRCNAETVCLPDPSCANGDPACAAQCWGFCEAAPSCEGDSDCDDGETCVIEYDCPCDEPSSNDSGERCLAPCTQRSFCAAT